MKTNKVTVTLKLNTDEPEDRIFKRLKQIANEEFQDYELSVCGYDHTLKHKFNKEILYKNENKNN